MKLKQIQLGLNVLLYTLSKVQKICVILRDQTFVVMPLTLTGIQHKTHFLLEKLWMSDPSLNTLEKSNIC